MNSKTVLFAALLALVSVSALSEATVVTPEVLNPQLLNKTQVIEHRDVVLEPSQALDVLNKACGQRRQADVPFSADELVDLVNFGTKSDAFATHVCKAFHARRAA